MKNAISACFVVSLVCSTLNAEIISTIEFEARARRPPGINLEPLLRGVADFEMLVDIGWSAPGGLTGVVPTTVKVVGFSDAAASEFEFTHNQQNAMGLKTNNPQVGSDLLDSDLNEGFVITLDQPYVLRNLSFAAGGRFGGQVEVAFLGQTHTQRVRTSGGGNFGGDHYIPENTPVRVTATSGLIGLDDLVAVDLGVPQAVPEPSSFLNLGVVLLLVWSFRRRRLLE